MKKSLIRVGEQRSIRGYTYTVKRVLFDTVRAVDSNGSVLTRSHAGWRRLTLVAEGPAVVVSGTRCPAAFTKRFHERDGYGQCQECGRWVRLRPGFWLPIHHRP